MNCKMLLRAVIAPLTLAPLAASCDEGAFSQSADIASRAGALTSDETIDERLDGTSSAEPNPANIEGIDELRAAYERMIAESPESAARTTSLPASDAGRFQSLAPTLSQLAPGYCSTDHQTVDAPVPSARPGARDVVAAKFVSTVEPGRRALARPEHDREDADELESLIGTDIRWVPVEDK